jgi:hypothetical protein
MRSCLVSPMLCRHIACGRCPPCFSSSDALGCAVQGTPAAGGVVVVGNAEGEGGMEVGVW